MMTVNAIAPGFIETDMTGVLTDETKQSFLTGMIPLGRFGAPEDIATGGGLPRVRKRGGLHHRPGAGEWTAASGM